MSNVTASGLIHLILHAAVPGAIAWLFFRKNWLTAWLIMLATMLVDLDHLLASPAYDPARCSIGFHPLHQWPAIVVYSLLLRIRPLRLVAIGLLTHMLLDGLDCLI
ncbi:MAG: DUF6122 family protein [Gammaproteobacteria bacterium]|nr:DUF6122 family protein [Gammaproteobacteria bacterium]